MSMNEPTLTTAGFQNQKEESQGFAGLPYQRYSTGIEAHPGSLFTQGPRTTPTAESLFSESEHPVLGNLSSRQFAGGSRPQQEDED